VDTEWFTWLQLSASRLFVSPTTFDPQFPPTAPIPRDYADSLMRINQLRGFHGFSAVRLGFLWLAGSITVDGALRRFLHPLVTLPVVPERPPLIGPGLLRPFGMPMLGDIVVERDARTALDGTFEYGGGALDTVQEIAAPPALVAQLTRLHTWANRVVAAAGCPTPLALSPAGANPTDLLAHQGLRLICGVAAYVQLDGGATPRTATSSWPTDRLGEATSFHHLYLDELGTADTTGRAPTGIDDDDDPTDIATGFVLNATQRRIIRQARTQPITVVSGAPGTGKSQTVAALADDVVGRGGSILIAARNEAAVEALLALMSKHGAVTPLVFGANRPSKDVAQFLADGPEGITSSKRVDLLAEELEKTRAESRRVRSRIARVLDVQREIESEGERTGMIVDLPASSLQQESGRIQLRDSLERYHGARGVLRFFRRRAALRRGRAVLRQRSADLLALEAALRAAERWAMKAEVRYDGANLDGEWEQLWQLDERLRQQSIAWLKATATSEQRWNRHSVAAVGALATSLRAGRAARRTQLQRFRDDQLTLALPVWIGTLADIDDLLPPLPNLFDLVVIDEAQGVEQRQAPAALLRARRAVIVGDPRQLRPVSFVADDDIEAAVARQGIDARPPLASRLDVRRNTLWDAAASASLPLMIGQHYRCDPHLIDWVARSLYGGELKIATRSPRNHASDCISVTRLQGSRDGQKVVHSEVRWIIDQLGHAVRSGARSVGVVTPFRAQADALVAAAMASFSSEQLIAMDLRIGTAHEFQGNERSLIYVSLGIGDDEGTRTWAFADDPHLLAVMLTRARQFLRLAHSSDPPNGSRLADYLRFVDTPPGPAQQAITCTPTARAIIDELRHAGATLWEGYDVGGVMLPAAGVVDGAMVAVLTGTESQSAVDALDAYLAIRRAGFQIKHRPHIMRPQPAGLG
jgi:hypothetical protein